MTEDATGVERTNAGERHERSVRLTIPAMDCPSCAQKVDKGLQRVDGVTDATLHPTTSTATVRYDADRADESDVVAAIEGTGYARPRGVPSSASTNWASAVS